MTLRIQETTIGAICGNNQVKSLIGNVRGFVGHPAPSQSEDSVVPAHSSGSSNPITMASNRANQSLEDQFLRWRRDMETKREEQARQMVELQSHDDHL